MACDDCLSTAFKRKLGRCKTCAWQLIILSGLCWPLWYWLYASTPKAVESIALLFFCCSFTGLLLLHGVVWIYRRLAG
ncbi:DUF3624 domain-containing protein [Neiella sp. HB171785]|uniref:DUF3624 domain-containing protein n=1 Tax=Neiella litorisoli TaxID=2771431 RepID=A0A8J6UGG0_9GAMM|nr:DUF3624 domain-containing protein [Neiella litorisoli]MBD1390061.1 DUF3624 domain-containing protein [Neiella litorisoli]